MEPQIAGPGEEAVVVAHRPVRRDDPLGDHLEVPVDVRRAAVDVLETIEIDQILRGQGRAGQAAHVRIGGQGGDAASNEERGFRLGEQRVGLGRVAPVGLGDPEVLQDVLGTQEAGRQGQGGDARAPEVPGHGVSQAQHRRLDHVVQDLAAIAVAQAVGDLQHQSALLLDHHRQGVTRGDQVADQGLVEQGADGADVEAPDLGIPVDHPVAAPDVVDQHVQPALLGLDAGDERLHLRLVLVIDPDGVGGPAGGFDQFGGLLDDLRASRGRDPAPAGAARAIDYRPGPAELDGDAATCAPGGAGDQGDLSVQRLGHVAISGLGLCSEPA